jgi:hypothetical protein
MTDIVKDVQKVANKVYKNGKTLAENFQSGLFVSRKHFKMDKDMKDLVNARFDSLEALIKDKMSKISK